MLQQPDYQWPGINRDRPAVAAAEVLDAQHVILAHHHDWRHVRRSEADTRRAPVGAGLTNRLRTARLVHQRESTSDEVAESRRGVS
ncbi:hypothetical protein [Ruania rhizosphaerae]|uniref:hypothetical protein n=1 Tax=Ruania rhizosphaerae TaxID=1840413 RepID=UPI00135A87DF|nr:hypothetical protein [Ruania rhizosphaerae]